MAPGLHNTMESERLRGDYLNPVRKFVTMVTDTPLNIVWALAH